MVRYKPGGQGGQGGAFSRVRCPCSARFGTADPIWVFLTPDNGPRQAEIPGLFRCFFTLPENLEFRLVLYKN